MLIRTAILSSRVSSSHASSWSEYLCLSPFADGLFELSVRVYEVLGEVSDYEQFDDDGNEIKPQLPTFIGGKQIAAIEDGFIVGGELIYLNEDLSDVVVFRRMSDKISTWLISKDWFSPEILQSISDMIDPRSNN